MWRLLITVCVVVMVVYIPSVMAEPSLPSWANSGGAEQKVSTIGKNVVDFIGAIGVIIALIAGSFGAIKMMRGNAEEGKQTLANTGMGLVVLVALYGIVGMFV